MSPPNILLVILDTARRDAVEPFGAPAGATPTIADLARRGAAFERAYSNCSWTMPAHASMFSGLLPRRMGLAQAPDGLNSVRPILESFRDRLLPVVLSSRGYDTQAWVTNHWVSRHAGFDLGFRDFQLVDSERTQRMEALVSGGRRAQLAWASEGLLSRHDDGAAEVGRQLVDSIRRWEGKPTFWFVNLTECHSPYLPPRPWNDLPPWDRVRAALDVRRHLNFVAICLYAAGRQDVTPEAFERMKRLYRRAISYMDDWLSGILEALETKRILDETLVIVTSDHGENFGEDGLIAHGFSLDERLINVPLVMSGPGVPDPANVISLADLPQVIASAAGIADSPWRTEDRPTGIAVAEYDPMAPLDSPKIRDFARQYGLSDADLGPVCARFTAATDGRHKLVVRNGVESLFDLDTDPDERAPIGMQDAPATVDGLRAAAATAEAAAAQGDAELPPPATTQAPDPPAEEIEAIERQMKLLGYM